MKTKTHFKKTAIRSGAVVVSFVLISFTVTAQDFWKKILTNSSFNEIAIAMIETGDEKTTGGSSSSTGADWESFEMAFDPALELEGWMSDIERFGVDNFSQDIELENIADFSSANVFPEADEVLSLENWMIEDDIWIK